MTNREKQIARALARGLSYKQVGGQVGLSPGTVRNYVHRMARRFPNPYSLSPKALVVLLVKQAEERKAS